MRKYLLRYLIFWAPAVLVACLFNNASPLSQILQWFFAFFMLLGWCANTAMAAYHYPRRTLSVLLMYLGINLLAIVALYNINTGSSASMLLLRLGGLLSFTPLDILVMALLDFSIPHEIYVTVGVVILCFLGWLAGLFYRRIHPNPYRPTMQ